MAATCACDDELENQNDDHQQVANELVIGKDLQAQRKQAHQDKRHRTEQYAGQVQQGFDWRAPLNHLKGNRRKRACQQEADEEAEKFGTADVDYIYEQPPEEMLRSLLPRFVATQLYRGMLESVASEHAARMTAMDSASNNASDMIDSLTLTMNRVRQAAITKEIIEIVSGAAAL